GGTCPAVPIRVASAALVACVGAAGPTSAIASTAELLTSNSGADAAVANCDTSMPNTAPGGTLALVTISTATAPGHASVMAICSAWFSANRNGPVQPAATSAPTIAPTSSAMRSAMVVAAEAGSAAI